MKKIRGSILFCLSLLLVMASCEEEEATIVTGEVISPIIKYVLMPSQSNTVPGSAIYINGVGFSSEDSIYCKSLEGESNFSPTVISADNYGITILVPEIAGGEYEVSVIRNGLTTILDKHLFVAFVFSIDKLQVPSMSLPGDELTATGQGFESGDKVLFESDFYPQGVNYLVDATINSEGISFMVPEGSYGINKLTLIRGKKTCSMGNVKIPVSIGARIGGGVVFYTSDDGVHGLIVAPENVLTERIFGPSIQVEPYATGTSENIYKGKANTNILVNGIKSWRNAGNSTQSTAAELCYDYSVQVDGVVYDDWFLGSLAEMSELFKYRATLTNPYELVNAQNYWTSTVFPGSNWAWAYYYVNFWEQTNLVSGAAPCDVWAIAARPIRQF